MLIPVMMLDITDRKPLPVYDDGLTLVTGSTSEITLWLSAFSLAELARASYRVG
jgi:hypothetical protein